MSDGTTGGPSDATPSVSPYDHRRNDARQRRDCLHPSGDYFRVICANGSTQVKLLCSTCHLNMLEAGESVPHSTFRSHEWIPIIADYRTIENPCERCGEVETELHHWAPLHLFADAADWPQSYLCIPCHLRWHARIIEHYQAA